MVIKRSFKKSYSWKKRNKKKPEPLKAVYLRPLAHPRQITETFPPLSRGGVLLYQRCYGEGVLNFYQNSVE